MNKEDILKLVLPTHDELGEKAAILKGFLEVVKKKDVWLDVAGIVEFYNTAAVEHFLKENALIGIILKNPGITSYNVANLSKLIQEHQKMMKDFRQLKELSEQASSGDSAAADDFIRICYKMINGLSAHAKDEDAVLYPLASKILNDTEMAALSSEIKRITKAHE